MRKRQRLLALCLAGVFALWLGGWAAAKFLIVRSPLPHAEAIAVLSGSANLRERATLAAELYGQGLAPRIILTNDNQQGGWSSAEQRNPFFYERSVALLREGGVPLEAIEVLPQPVSGTHDEALLFRQYAESHHLRSLLVVTSAYHSRRALWMLRNAFANSQTIIGLECVPPGGQSPSPASWWLHWRGWVMVPPEYPKMIYYAIQARVSGFGFQVSGFKLVQSSKSKVQSPKSKVQSPQRSLELGI